MKTKLNFFLQNWKKNNKNGSFTIDERTKWKTSLPHHVPFLVTLSAQAEFHIKVICSYLNTFPYLHDISISSHVINPGRVPLHGNMSIVHTSTRFHIYMITPFLVTLSIQAEFHFMVTCPIVHTLTRFHPYIIISPFLVTFSIQTEFHFMVTCPLFIPQHVPISTLYLHF